MKIEVQHLTRVFGKAKAVDDLSFSFSSGDVVGFVGPNGAGKTTTMNIMSTLDEPTAGDVLLDGRSILDYPDEARRRIGFMPLESAERTLSRIGATPVKSSTRATASASAWRRRPKARP